MSKWIPWPAYHDDAPLDLRGVYNDAPAGRHGFLKTEGERFVFADGTVARFWGTNFNGAACFPEHEYAEKIARRLAKLGCNMVRYHQLDAEWHTPNIFRFTRGQRLKNTLEFDPESMDRLDYLTACLKNEGIYIYMDVLTYRKFKSGDGVENAFRLPDAAKPYASFDRRMIELQKKFCCDFWTHVNPYTGLENRDDPVFVMGEIVNESNFQMQLLEEPYVSDFRQRYADWLSKNAITGIDPASCDVNEDAEPLLTFKYELEAAYYREMMDYLRGIGVKIPLAGTNMGSYGSSTKSQLEGDYVDNHAYYYSWTWQQDRLASHVRCTQSPTLGMERMVSTALKGMPGFVSEWDMPWPNAYRAESPLLFAAAGLLQGWSGFTIHTHSYMAHLDRMHILGKEASSDAIGGTAFREGIFTAWNDPAKFGLFYHAALMTRRGDVRRAETDVDVKLTDMRLHADYAAIRTMSERCRVNIVFEGEGLPQDQPIIPAEAGEVRSDTGELFRSWEKGFGIIDTPRTQAVYGLLEKQGTLSTADVTVKATSDFGVIAISSLTDDPISASDNLLLTTVGRAENTGMRFEDDHLTDFGKPPILAEVIEAAITIKNARRDLRVWAVNAEGMYHGVVPASFTEEGMTFTVGQQFPSIYYLIQAE